MLIRSLIINGRLSPAAYRDVLTSVHQWNLMGHSLVLSLLVTLLTVMAGLPLGILLGKTDLPLRRFFTVLFILPLLIPPYIMAVSWVDLLGNNGFLATLTGPSVTGPVTHALFGLAGCVGVLFSIFLPIPMLLTMVFLRTVNPRLEEAGRLVSGWRGVMKGITLPLLLPGLLFSAVLVFLLTFGEFSVPSYLRYDVFPLESFIRFSAFYDFKAATASAFPLIVVTFFLLLAEAFFLKMRTHRLLDTAENERPSIIRLGARRKGWTIAVGGMGFILVIVPFLTLIWQSGGLAVYAEAWRRAGDSLIRSLVYAIGGATLLTLLGFFTGYLIQTKTLPFRRAIDAFTIFLFALPGTVIGIGLISLWNTPWTNFIYRTPLIILFGYLAKYTALTSRISIAQLAQIPPSMEEVAQIAGGSWFRRMTRIILPLARRGLIVGWVTGYIFSLRDTAITMLVYPPGHDTLPVRIFTLMANGAPELIAALCIIMIAALFLPAGVLWVFRCFRVRMVTT